MLAQFVKATLFTIVITLSNCSFAFDNDLLSQLSMKNSASAQQNIITGGQPTKDDLKLLADRGVLVVINLRTKGEFNQFDEQSLVQSLGMKYIHIPVAGAKGQTDENLALFVKAISNEKTLVHCASSNRVGAMFALDAVKNKQFDVNKAMSLGKKTGLKSLQTKVLQILDPQ